MDGKYSKKEVIDITLDNLKQVLPLAVLTEKNVGYVIAASIRNLEIVKEMDEESTADGIDVQIEPLEGEGNDA